MTILEQLHEVKALIDTPDKWHQHWYAITADGEDVYPSDARACKFCLMGAILRVSRKDDHTASAAPLIAHLLPYLHELNYLLLNTPTDNPNTQLAVLVELNDLHGFTAVHTLLDMAITHTATSDA